MRIIGPSSALQSVTVKNLSMMNCHPRFLNEMLPELWDMASAHLIDPVGMVAQSYKETGRGNFTGNVKPEFFNPCGLKVRYLGKFPGVDDGDLPLAHQQFPNWSVGALAQAQHLRIYAGWPVENELIVDPRYVLVKGQRCENWTDLSGKWAPSLSYGQEIETIMKQLQTP